MKPIHHFPVPPSARELELARSLVTWRRVASIFIMSTIVLAAFVLLISFGAI